MSEEQKELYNKIYWLCVDFMRSVKDESNYTDDENELIDELVNVINTYENWEYVISREE